MEPAETRDLMRRLTDQIRAQHDRMIPTFGELMSLISEGRLLNAQTTAFQLQGALRAHFLLEEEVVFALFGSLYPDLAAEVSTLTQDHRSLDSRFDDLIGMILVDALRTPFEPVTAFGADLDAHEQREESLLRRAADTQG